MTAGCQLFGGPRGEEEPAAEVDPSQLPAVSELFVERSVDALPPNPEEASLGITAQGIFQYDPPDGEWQPIMYGTEELPIGQLTAESAMVGATPSGRPLISNQNRTVYVSPNGDDAGRGTHDDPLASVQEAVQRVPIYLRHKYVIDLSTVPETPVRYDEDVLVPTIIGTGRASLEDGAEEAGPFLNFVIRGDENDTGFVEVGSMMFANVVGTAAGNLFSVTITRDTPYDNEGFALTAYGSGEVHLYDVRFTDGVSNAILAYGAKMKASLVDVGDGNVNIGIRGKRHGRIIADRSMGRTTGSAYFAISNAKIGIKQGETLTGQPTYETGVGGLIHDDNTDTWHGIEPSTENASTAQASSGAQSPAVRTDHPSDPGRGDVWYVDGEGAESEGFYGQTRDGPTRLS